MELGLEGRTAVVLASTSGLGLAVAEALAAEGANVAISGRHPDRLNRAVDRLASESGDDRIFGQQLDVTDDGALVDHLNNARDRFGAVDILVTNAGGPPPGPASEVERDDLDRAYHLTLRSAVVAIREVLPWMRERRWGRIIAMTSSAVRHPIPNLALSNVFRAGLTAYLKTLAGEVAADGVLVNSIATGMFDTDRLESLFQARARAGGRTPEEERERARAAIPVGRLGVPREFGAMVAFMASERASFLCGVALPLDGGASTFLL